MSGIGFDPDLIGGPEKEDPLRRIHARTHGLPDDQPLPMSMGRLAQNVINRTRHQPFGFEGLAPGYMDEMDQLAARTFSVSRQLLPAPDYGMDAYRAKPELRGTFLSGLAEGFKDTYAGTFLNYIKQKSIIEESLGPIAPVGGYDYAADPQIAQAGLEGEPWRFHGSQSPNETALRIAMIHDRSARQSGAEWASPLADLGLFAGQNIDPLIFVGPTSQGIKAVGKLHWGMLWQGGKIASANAALSLATEAAKNKIDGSYEVGSVMEIMALPAALGFAVGSLGALSKHHRDKYGVPKMEPPFALQQEGASVFGTQGIHIPEMPPAFELSPAKVAEAEAKIPAGPLRHRADFDAFMTGNRVSDESGSPIRVYHGTDRTFVRHSDEKLGTNTGAASAREGHFFAGNPETTAAYYGALQADVSPTLWQMLTGKSSGVADDPDALRPQIRPTYIRMTNPFVVIDNQTQLIKVRATDEEAMAKAFRKAGGRGFMSRGELNDSEGRTWVQHGGKWYPKDALIVENTPLPDMTDWSTQQKARFMTTHAFPVGEGDLTHYRQVIYPIEQGVDEIEITQTTSGRFIRYTENILEAKKLGHDGVIFRQTKDGGPLDNIYVVFDTKNIKGFDERYEIEPVFPQATTGKIRPENARSQVLRPDSSTDGLVTTDSGVAVRVARKDARTVLPGKVKGRKKGSLPASLKAIDNEQGEIFPDADGGIWRVARTSEDLKIWQYEEDFILGQRVYPSSAEVVGP